MGRNKKRRLIELGKDALILLLTCSALWLATRTQMWGPLNGLFREEGTQVSTGQNEEEGQVEMVLPMAVAFNLPQESGVPGGAGDPGDSRYGVRYDQETCQELFQQVAGPLVEALSSAGTPEQIDRTQWESVLRDTPGVYLDFQGEIPLPVLTRWLSGEEGALNATVRRMVLAVWQEGVALYYRDEADGNYYRCQSEVVDPRSLTETLSSMAGNGAFFAFESELYPQLAPDTLLLSAMPSLSVYTATNPVGGGQEDLESILQDLGFPLNSTNFYPTDVLVARNEDDSVRLSDRGVAVYTAGEGSDRFAVSGEGETAPLLDSVEMCRQLAIATLAPRCGEARLYLMSAVATDSGWEIEFGYSLNGIPVRLEEGYAARFVVEGSSVTQFTLHFRSYTSNGTTSTVLPVRQAAAALVAQGLAGEELTLIYPDSGGDTLTAGWAARGDVDGEE